MLHSARFALFHGSSAGGTRTGGTRTGRSVILFIQNNQSNSSRNSAEAFCSDGTIGGGGKESGEIRQY